MFQPCIVIAFCCILTVFAYEDDTWSSSPDTSILTTCSQIADAISTASSVYYPCMYPISMLFSLIDPPMKRIVSTRQTSTTTLSRALQHLSVLWNLAVRKTLVLLYVLFELLRACDSLSSTGCASCGFWDKMRHHSV